MRGYRQQMSSDPVTEFPRGTADERELLLRWLRYLRGAVTRKLEGLSDEQARWTPDGALISPVSRLSPCGPGADRRGSHGPQGPISTPAKR